MLRTHVYLNTNGSRWYFLRADGTRHDSAELPSREIAMRIYSQDASVIVHDMPEPRS